MGQPLSLTRERWQRIEAILDEVLELAEEARTPRLAELCGDDHRLVSEVRELLAAESTAAGDFLRVPAAAAAAELFDWPEVEPAREVPEGRMLGPYRLVRLIGAGGMGRVFEALDTRLGRSVAVKILPPELGRAALAKDRFLREARAASRLDHPNIITIHDVGESAAGELYLVTAFYDGETLAQRLLRGPLAFDEARLVTVAVARALAHAHAAGVLHRDIKPANIMLVKGGEARVLDFGIARIAGEAGPTQTGHTPGTPAYMSPEQVQGLAVDERADLWALGATLYEMLAGQRAFPGDDPQAVLFGILNRDPEPLARLRPEVPPELARVAARLLAKRPVDRPVHAAELVAELQGGEAPLRAAEGVLASGYGLGPATGIAARPAPLLRVLVASELVPGPWQAQTLGDEGAFTFSARHDRAVRDLVARFGGQEVEKSGESFLVLFERAADAVDFGLAYHASSLRLGRSEGFELAVRVGIHLGEVLLRRNPEADVARGARPLEVEGQATAVAARLVALAGPHQTLLTRTVFDLARRAALAFELGDAELGWLAHGAYAFTGGEEPIEVFEVGVKGFAPLAEPPSTVARRVVALGDELALGWRPASGQPVPRRPNWTLAERIGEGGFGEVWLAEHKSGEKRVFKFCFEAARLRALKREVTLFRLLRDALGHRHDIARILDWSFEQPPFFLEAEYSEGGNLSEWAAAHGGLAAIPLADRLALAAEVGEALGAAHSVGILHKDVKPENVLVALDRDGKPHARLTDFGIGLLDPAATSVMPSSTVLGFTATASVTETAAGGTVRYMAPELLEGRPASIQADIYSLGVLIYQLVAGDFARALASGWQRDVPDELLAEDLATFLDGRPERRPASALAVAESLRTLEARRAAREAEQRRALEAAATRAALERHERRRKLATWVASASVLVLAVVGILAMREQRARKTASLRQQQAENLIGYMLGDLRDKLEPVGRLEILDSVGEKAMEYFAAVPVGELSDEELARRSQALYQIGDVRMRRGDLAAAIRPFEESLALARELAARDPLSPKRQFDLAQSHFWLGSAHLEKGELVRAKEEFMSYFELALRSVERDPSDRTWQMELAYAHTNLAAVAEAAGSLAEAAREVGKSLAIKEALAANEPGNPELGRSLAGGHSWLARIRARQGELRDALAEYERERGLRDTLLAREPGNADAKALLATSLSHVADLEGQLGRSESALAHLDVMERLLSELTTLDPANGSWKRDLAVCHRRRGELRAALGDHNAARRELVTATRLLTELGASASPSFDWQRDAAWVKVRLAAAFFELGELAPARQALEPGIAALDELSARRPEDPRTLGLAAEALLLRGRLAAESGDGAAAARDWQRAYTLLEPQAGASSDPVLLAPFAELLTRLERFDQAEQVRARLRASGVLDGLPIPSSNP